MKWAMEQAISDLNAKGGILGRPVVLKFYDTMNKPDVCAQSAKSLVEVDKAVAVVGELHSGCAEAEEPALEAGNMPTVFSDTYADAVTAGDPTANPPLPANAPTIFRIAPTNSYVSGFIADWLVNGLKATHLIDITDNTEFGVGRIKALTDALTGTGVKLTTIQVEIDQPDYTAVLTRLEADNPDYNQPTTVVAFDASDQGTLLTLTKNGIDAGLVDKSVCLGPPTVTQDSKTYFQAVPNGQGCVFQYVGLAPSQLNSLAQSVNAREETALGHGASNEAYEGYDTVGLVADAITRAGSTDSAAIVKALETTSWVGCQGKYSFPYNSTNPAPSGKGYLWHTFPNPPLQYLEYLKANDTLANAVSVWPASLQSTPGSAYFPVTR
jgi:ABC-type branched-subunit amino acid transport system substrate-binding protein